jgi:hypothetical protein
MGTNLRELEGPATGDGGLVTLDNLAQARAVHELQAGEVQENPALAAKEHSNYLLSQRTWIFVGHSQIALNIDDRYSVDVTFLEFHDTLNLV